jgi:hypothetical protein
MAEFDENEIEFAAAVTAMLEAGYCPMRLRWLITQLNFRHDAAVQARRGGLHIVGAVPPGR